MLASLGATVTFRSRVLVNAVGVRVPAGRLESLAALAEVRSPWCRWPSSRPPRPAPRRRRAGPRGPPRAPAPAAGAGPAHIALIDAGVDASHPWLGGGIGPTFPIIGGPT